MAFEGYSEKAIAVRLAYRAEQLIAMLDVQDGCPSIVLNEQRAMIRDAAMALPAGKHVADEEENRTDGREHHRQWERASKTHPGEDEEVTDDP